MRTFLSKGPKRVARTFLAGLLVVLPAVITLAIIAWVADFVHKVLGPRTLIGDGLTHVGLSLVTNDTVAYLIGWLLAIVCVWLLGLVVEAGAKEFIQRIFDASMKRIPIVGSIYGTSKQLVTLFEKKDPEKMQGMKAVFCFFGEKTARASWRCWSRRRSLRSTAGASTSSSCRLPPCPSAADCSLCQSRWCSQPT